MSANIKVAVRMRPFTEGELAANYQNSFVDVDKRNKQITVTAKGPDCDSLKEYGFDCVLDEKATQEDVYRGCGMDYLVSKALEGYNSTIFLYGQTGSGKTFTMQGESVNDVTDGVIPRITEALYSKISSNKCRSFGVSVSYLQVYSEKVYDLLNPLGYNGKNVNPRSLRLRWSKQNQFTVQNLFVFECQSADELLQYVRQGLANRVNAAHRLNISSSRSHSILTIRVDSKERDDPSNILSSRIELVDLAGSERTSLTGSEGRLAKESIDINKSLFTLRQVITTLAEDPSGHIPYRESKLTSLLKHSIGGNCYCLMIACVSPNDLFLDENISTLVYATKASQIKNSPMVNRDPQQDQITRLQSQIQQLNKELQKAIRNTQITNAVTSNKGNMQNFLQRAEMLLSKVEKDRGNVKSDNYWLMFLESIAMVRDLLKSNRELREQTDRYKALLDRRDLEVFELYRQNEQFRMDLSQSSRFKPLLKRQLRNPKTEHLKTEHNLHSTEPGLYVPIVAMLERTRNKAMLNTFISTQVGPGKASQELSEVRSAEKRLTELSFNSVQKIRNPTGVRIRTHSSNDQHDDRSIRRHTFQQTSPERFVKRMTRMLNT